MALTGNPWDLQRTIQALQSYLVTGTLPGDWLPVHLVGKDDVTVGINGFVEGEGAAVLIADLDDNDVECRRDKEHQPRPDRSPGDRPIEPSLEDPPSSH